MLVGASSESLNDLNRVILQRGTQKILHNLSVIEEIQPWSRQRRNPEGSVRLLEHGRAVLRLFQYQHDVFNAFNYETVQRTLKSFSLPFIEIAQGRGLPVFAIRDLDKIQDDHLELLLNFPGIRTVFAEPVFRPRQAVATPQSGENAAQASAELDGLPTVGVFDTGVSPSAKAIAHYVASRDTYVLPPDTNYEHGTAVGSLVAAGAHFNNKHAWLPSTPAMIHDVCALEVGGSNMSDLELRLSQAVRRRPDVKIWNISIGGDPCDESLFGDFAMTMDELSDKYQVLFVVAAGNYNDEPRRQWLTPATLADRISCPGESVRSLTVGSISHINAADALTAIGHPAPYSRSGPGPVFTPKPDITHVGGGVHAPWNAGQASLLVLGPTDQLQPATQHRWRRAWRLMPGGPSPVVLGLIPRRR
nr:MULTISPECIES: S8 family serine peptidase [unclassified Pseudomonas]